MPQEASVVRTSYDRLARSYDVRWKRYVEASMAMALEGVTPVESEIVLDVACGTGELEDRLAAWRPGHMIGIDLSLNMLRAATYKSVQAQWAQAEAYRLPFADAAFDRVLCLNAFHYFHHPLDALAEIRRVLKPAGSFLLVDWCDDYLTCRLCSLWLRWSDAAFYRTYAQSECERLLQSAGFQVRSSRRAKIDWLWGLMRVECSRR